MKKIYSLVVLLLLACVNVAHAQKEYTIAEQSTDEILAGEDHLYVIQEGENATWSKSGFLFCGVGDQCSPKVTEECIYSFIQVDEKVVGEEKFPVYVLKNRYLNKYLTNKGDELYVNSRYDAFKFTARKGVLWPTDAGHVEDQEWIVYSNAVETGRCPNAEAWGAWVLCSPTSQTYIGFYTNPSFMSYIDTNNWLIKEAKEKEMSAIDKMMAVYNKYIDKKFVDETNYPVGTAPGCISKEVFDLMAAAQQMALDAMDVNDAEKLTPEEIAKCDAAREALINAFTRYENEMVQVGAGYYVLVNGRSNDMAYDDGVIARCKLNTPAPDGWTVENAKYIWEVVPSASKGEFYLKNWGTGRYLGLSEDTSKPFKTIADTTVKFTFPQFQAQWFRIKCQDGNFAHNDAGGVVVRWNSTGSGNWFRFDAVPVDTIDSLSIAVNQGVLNNKLANLVTSAKNDILGVQTESGWTEDASFASPGLVKEATTNASEGEGPVDRLFDGKLNTFFHSSWSSDPGHDDYHCVEVDLGHAVTNLYIKMAERHNNQKNSPTKAQIIGVTEDDPEVGEWGEVLADIDTIEYTLADSMVYIGKITLLRPAQHIRFAAVNTVNNACRPEHPGKPYWSCAEMRFFDGDQSAENPLFASVPKDVKDALNAAIAKAEKEVADKLATQETYDALETALENFWEAYPDPDALTEKIESIEALVNAAQEDEAKLGFFQVGAKQVMLDVITELKAKVTKTCTVAELEAIEKELDTAYAAFNAKLNLPAGGLIYRILSASPVMNGDKYRAQHEAAICAENADTTATPVWDYGQDAEGNIASKANCFNTLWQVEKDDKGYTFRNLSNGLYMDNKYEGLTKEEIKKLDFGAVGYSKTPKHFTLEAAAEPGAFVIVMTKGEYINLQPTGHVVHYSVRDDAHAPFKFLAAEGQALADALYWNVDIKPGVPQIVTLPIAVSELMFDVDDSKVVGDFGVYKLDGILDGALQFSEFGDLDEVPAGTPMLVVSPEVIEGAAPVKSFMATVNSGEDDLTAVKNMEYCYDSKNENGMISAPVGFLSSPKFGVLIGGELVVSEGGERIESGSGYFNNTISATDVEGSYSLVCNGEITGDVNTSIGNVEFIKNVPNDVYTISGVKVRSNVKAAAATKNLPKGIYIVGGKKVVVK